MEKTENLQNQEMSYEEINAIYLAEKLKEDKRHKAQILKLENIHSNRMKSIREQETDYKRRLAQLKIKYARERDKLEKKHESTMQLLLETNHGFNGNMISEIDADYIEAVGIELKKLLIRYHNGQRARERSDKLHAINSGVDSLISKRIRK